MQKKGFLGIDVSKGYADFLLLGSDMEVLEEGFQLADNKEGRQKLKDLIAGWQVKGLEELYCGVESTGGYENNWYSYLKMNFRKSRVFVCRINPRGVKSLGEATLKRTITDAVSAENIASYLIKFPEKLDYGLLIKPGNDGFKEGRQHLICIKMQLKQKVQLSNQLEKLLYQYLSEILVYCRHGTPDWLLTMLVKYPTAAMMVKAGAVKLSATKGISMEKAETLIKKVKDSVQNVSSQISHIIIITAKEILHKEALIKVEKQYLADLYKDAEEVLLINSVIGLGINSSVALALEIEDVNRFETVNKITSFFGLHPTYKQSGDNTWGNHMSKTGRGEIRAILYMASLSAVRFNPVIKQVYARSRAKGMNHYQAAGVVMHKLLRIIYGILKSKTKFNPAIDEQNQEKATAKQHNYELKMKESNTVKINKKHRFQTTSKDAPTSRRAETKRKKQIASQTSNLK